MSYKDYEMKIANLEEEIERLEITARNYKVRNNIIYNNLMTLRHKSDFEYIDEVNDLIDVMIKTIKGTK